MRLVLLKKQKETGSVYKCGVNRRITITIIIVRLRREKCSFHSQDFLSFCSLTNFPSFRPITTLKFAIFMILVLIVCESRYASRTQSKCFSSCFCYLNVLNRSCFEVLSDRAKSLQSLIFNTRSVHRPSTKKCDQVPRCKLSKQRCTSFNLSQRSLYFLKCS